MDLEIFPHSFDTNVIHTLKISIKKKKHYRMLGQKERRIMAEKRMFSNKIT